MFCTETQEMRHGFHWNPWKPVTPASVTGTAGVTRVQAGTGCTRTRNPHALRVRAAGQTTVKPAVAVSFPSQEASMQAHILHTRTLIIAVSKRRKSLQRTSMNARVERMMTLLVESGIVYCVFTVRAAILRISSNNTFNILAVFRLYS